MNKIVIEQKQKSQHAVKNSFFDLWSLWDQLYKFRSKVTKSSFQGHIHFSKNLMLYLIAEKIKNLAIAIELFNKLIRKNNILLSNLKEKRKERRALIICLM